MNHLFSSRRRAGLLLLVCLVRRLEAFVVHMNSNPCTALSASALRAETSTHATPTKPPSIKDDPALRWIHLPRVRLEEDARVAVIEQVEMWIGRVAMVGAMAVVFNEIFKGESIVEQVSDAASTLHL